MSDDESFDFGDDDDDDLVGDDDSDEDYEKAGPWARKKKATKQSQLEERHESEDFVGKKLDSDVVEADYDDFTKLALPRRRLARWCNEPFFERAVKDCYVRLGAGIDKKTGKRRYKLFQIVDIEKKSADYSFPKVGTKKPVSMLHFSSIIMLK